VLVEGMLFAAFGSVALCLVTLLVIGVVATAVSVLSGRDRRR
jgi:uncharacterized membrane protein